MRLYTRTGQKYFSEDGAKDWDGSTDLTPFKAELENLKRLLPTFAKFSMFGKENVIAVDRVVASDASGYGYGLVKVNCGRQKFHVEHEGPCSDYLSKRFFTPLERRTSSSMRELLALEGAYAAGALDGIGKSILHLTDSAPVEAIMRIGSPVPGLQKLALAIHTACREKGLKLRVEWRPREDERMVEADRASRMFDTDDFGCSRKDHLTVLAWAGFKFEFDLFASPTNAKCENFAVRFAENDRRDWVNAFTLDWQTLGEVFACPPPSLIVPVLRQFATQKAKGVLMIPEWRSAKYWPVLAPRGRHFVKMVVRFMRFSPKLEVGPEVISATFRRRQSFLVFRINGGADAPWEENSEFLGCIDRGCALCEE
jgi:hypothetical protein